MFKLRTLLAASGLTLITIGGITGGVASADPATEIAAAVGGGEVVDLTVTISENYPAHWPFHPPFRRWTMNWFETKDGPYTKTPAKVQAVPVTRFRKTWCNRSSHTTASRWL